MEGLPLKQILEGAILASETPLTIDQLMQLFETDPPERSEVRDVLQEIEDDFAGRGFELKQVASGYRFQVRSDYGEWVSRLWKEKPPRYSRALLETLALVAYKQPITRGDIEDIRGVAVSTNIMRTLIEREWVRVVGHRDVPGHPALYATTRNFLDYFNLKSLDELPNLSEIKDLTQANEQLNMEEDLIEVPRIIEIDDEENLDLDGVEDADLDAVSNQVNAIQENIKNLFEPPPEDAEMDELLEEELAQSVSAEGNLKSETETAEGAEHVSEDTVDRTAVNTGESDVDKGDQVGIDADVASEGHGNDSSEVVGDETDLPNEQHLNQADTSDEPQEGESSDERKNEG